MSKINHDREVLRNIDSKKRLKAEELRNADPRTVKAPTLQDQIRNEIQWQLMAIAMHWKKTRDTKSAVNSMNQLLLDYPKNRSPKKLQRWVNQHFGFNFDETTRTFYRGRKKGQASRYGRAVQEKVVGLACCSESYASTMQTKTRGGCGIG